MRENGKAAALRAKCSQMCQKKDTKEEAKNCLGWIALTA